VLRSPDTETAPAVIPRWEWRTFGSRFGAAEPLLAAVPASSVEDSEELYLLSDSSDASVKVRGGLMDVKLRLKVDDQGLEQWMPVLKAPFPLAASDVEIVLAALAIDQAGPPRDAADVGELVRAHPGVLAVAVHKRRRRSSVGGCMAELTDMETYAGATRTIAVESEDPERVSEAVRQLGLAARPVTCVPRGLRALLGLAAASHAVIDVGSNSVKLAIGERGPDGAWKVVVDRAEVTRLGQGLGAHGVLGSEPMRRTADAVAGMVTEARRRGVDGITAVGTAALRIAGNRADFLALVRRRSHVDVEVIPAREEARLAYLAACTVLGGARGPVVIFDTGGGSSQFTAGREDRVLEQFSVDVGAARFTERFGLDAAVPAATVAAARGAIAAELERVARLPRPDVVVGIGGANTNLAAVKHGLVAYDPAVVHGTVLDRAEIDRQIELYRGCDAAARREIAGLQPARAEVILAGACVVRTVLDLLGRDELRVSDRGLRHGVLAEHFAGASSGPAAFTRTRPVAS
jgi:exopolyphosphatase / guanosine-5'-triphosphate,3'-diphosphate pyrophosphatase